MTKAKKRFELPKSKLHMDRERGVLSAAIGTMASDERVLEATPSLKGLYVFLRMPLPWETARG